MKIGREDGRDTGNVNSQSGLEKKKLNKLGDFKTNQNNTDLLSQCNRQYLPRLRNSDDHYVFMDFTANSNSKQRK